MANSNSPSVLTIHFWPPATRLLLLAPALLAIFAAWFAVRWYVGDTVAEYAPGVEQGGLEMARVAERWAPADPFAHWTVGAFQERVFNAGSWVDTVREYEQAVALSPNDYRYWMVLGHALEATGDQAGAEKAMRRAVELAPAYAQPRWYFGNLLVREGKLNEAFQQLARAGSADEQMQPQVFNLAWQVFGGDVDAIARIACPSPDTRAQFAIYLVTLKRFDDARRIWETISRADRLALAGVGEQLKDSLIRSAQFHQALDVVRDIDQAEGERPVADQILNGGFENAIELASTKIFHWQIVSRPLAQITLDPHSHTGRRSLRIIFRAPNKLDAIPVAQTVVVQPGSQYRLECYVRSENLNSGSTPSVAILDAADHNVLASSGPLPTGTHDWQKIALDFKTRSDGIIIDLSRAPCGDTSVCPIFGNVWYDDFNLQRSGSSGPSR